MGQTKDTGCCGGSSAEPSEPTTSPTARGASTESRAETPPRGAEAHRDTVEAAYASVAQAEEAGESTGSGCCGVSEDAAINQLVSTRLGYSEQDLAAVPQSADMGLGCGNPNALAALQPGEVVVDLGAGGGLDCFLASRQVGDAGHVIGIDMTSDMLRKARRNAERGGFTNTEFRLGEIEHLPVADNTADVILSNCVINLSDDKPQVFREALRILKPGGRLAISDVVATVELPDSMRNDPQLVAGCMGNAALIDDLEAMMREAGFESIRIAPKDESREFIRDWAPGRGVEDYVQSATLEGVKPDPQAAKSTCCA